MKTSGLLYTTWLLATAATCVRVPADMPDGLLVFSDSGKRDGGWSVIEEYNATQETHDPTREIHKTALAGRRYPPVLKRDGHVGDVKKFDCPTSELDKTDYATAYNKMATACGVDVPIQGHTKAVYKVGSAMVFACNWKKERSTCSPTEFYEAMDIIDDNCGSEWKPGWIENKDWGKSWGREPIDADICENGMETSIGS